MPIQVFCLIACRLRAVDILLFSFSLPHVGTVQDMNG
jgi:hypothetical protein